MYIGFDVNIDYSGNSFFNSTICFLLSFISFSWDEISFCSVVEINGWTLIFEGSICHWPCSGTILLSWPVYDVHHIDSSVEVIFVDSLRRSRDFVLLVLFETMHYAFLVACFLVSFVKDGFIILPSLLL